MIPGGTCGARMTFSSRWARALAGACAAAAVAVGAVSAVGAAPAATGPTVLAEPQAGIEPFLTLIGGARSSIDLTMYELSDPQVEQVLAAAAHRGVNVRVLLNGGFYSHHETTNAAAYRWLAGHGVHVRYSPTYFALTHQKTLTVDGRESAIMTLNFDGLYPSTRDYAVLDSQRADVNEIVAAFNADYASRRVTASTGTGDLLWSPHAAPAVLADIAGARHSIDLESEEMAYTPAINALCAAARRGVTVRIVMTYASDWRSAFAHLGSCGVSVRLYHGQRYYIHAKLLIADGTRALVSSQNLSTGSLQYNRELGITLTAPAAVTRLQADFAADYAGAAAS